jgi:lipoprotein-releasing system permease protein
MLSLRIAARFLRKSRIQSLAIILGIAVGIGVQVFVGSLITSLQATLIDETIGSAPQVTVSGQQGRALQYTPELRAAMAGDPEVTTVVPVRTFSAIFRQGGETAPLNVIGGQLNELDTIYDVSSRTVLGDARLAGQDVMVGSQFADAHGLQPGDDITVVLPDGRPDRLTISGVFDLGSAAANERTAFVTAQTAADALALGPDEFTAVQEQLSDPFTSVAVADRLRSQPQVAGLSVTEWQSENGDLLDALKAQSSSSYMIQVFVLIAVALGIASTLAISAVQKTRQIGILKAMGLSDGSSAGVFVWEALVLGVTGAAVGVGAGLALIAGFNALGSGNAGSFPIVASVGFVTISFGVGVLVALLSAIVPSRRTSRVDPIEVIQGV